MSGRGIAALVVIGCVSCSGSTTADVSGASGGGGTSGGGTSGSGTSGGSGTKDGSQSTALVGVWDVFSNIAADDVVAGVITVTTTALTIDWAHQDLHGTPLSLAASMTDGTPTIYASWDDAKFAPPRDPPGAPITATRSAAPLDLGQIPYGIGGAWVFEGTKSDRCKVTAGPALVSLDCSNLGKPLVDPLEGWDSTTKMRLGAGVSTAQRTSQLDSVFGDLGGEWAVTLPNGGCALKIEGSTLTAACTYITRTQTVDRSRTGNLTLTFADGFASGMSDVGEISAKRQ